MPSRDLLPIAIPHGRSGNTGFVSVYLMPRLGFGPELSDFDDWTDWPAVVRAMTFTIRVNGNPVAFTQTSRGAEHPEVERGVPRRSRGRGDSSRSAAT